VFAVSTSRIVALLLMRISRSPAERRWKKSNGSRDR
jgi:hypothetical protein